jgi:hypothetical protein
MIIKGGELALSLLGGVWFKGNFWVWAFLARFVFVFELFLALICHFAWFVTFCAFVGPAIFPSFRWSFLAFWSSTCASWGFGFELQTLCFLLSMDSLKGRLRNQVASSLFWLWWVIVLPMFEFETFQLFYLYLYFVWRIMFDCLVVCTWQVRHGG